MTEPLYVCVYVPEFPAQALLRLRPELAKVPVAVLSGEPPFEEVCSANAHAVRLGVQGGMARTELGSFQGMAIWKRSEVEERSARAALLEAAGVYTPRIEVQPSITSAFVMVLDMAGTTRMFGAPAQAVHRIAQALTKLSFFVQMSASVNQSAAVCVAPAARKRPILIPAGREREFLSDLPLAAFPLTDQQAETLALWGLHTVGELAALPEIELIVRLGQEGKQLRLMALGKHAHLMISKEPAFALEEFIGFDAPVEILDSLLFVLGPMLDQLLARAQSRAFALASVTVKLGLDGGGEHERTIKPALPVLERSVLLKLLHLDLQAHPPLAGVMSIFVHAEPGDRSKVQLGLFSPQMPEPSRLDVTLARIAALVGEDCVGRPKLSDAHRPDSFTMERFSVPNSTSNTTRARECTRQSVALRRCRPPWPLSVQQDGSSLAAFFIHGRRYTVEQAYGPWRKSGEWWTSEVWSREEWDVCASMNTNGNVTTLFCIVSHNLLRHQWQIDAVYD